METPSKLSGALSVIVKIDGTETEELRIKSLVVFKEVCKIPLARLTIIDGSVPDGDFPMSNADTLIPGKEIEVLVGNNPEQETVFKGIITKHRVCICLLYTSPSPRDATLSRMPSSA